MKIFNIEIDFLIFKNLHFCSFFDEKLRKIENIIILWNLIIFRVFTKFTKFEKGGFPLLDIRKSWLKRYLKVKNIRGFHSKDPLLRKTPLVFGKFPDSTSSCYRKVQRSKDPLRITKISDKGGLLSETHWWTDYSTLIFFSLTFWLHSLPLVTFFTRYP